MAMAGFQLGNAIGLTLSPILMSQGGIFGPFVIFGLCGFLWVLVWLSATSSTPDRSPQISKYELDYIMDKRQKSHAVESKPKTKMIPPFRRLLSKMPTWSLIVANAMHSWVMHISIPCSLLHDNLINFNMCLLSLCILSEHLLYASFQVEARRCCLAFLEFSSFWSSLFSANAHFLRISTHQTLIDKEK